MLKKLGKRLSQSAGLKRNTQSESDPQHSLETIQDTTTNNNSDTTTTTTNNNNNNVKNVANASKPKASGIMKSTSKFFGNIRDGIAAGLSRQQVEDYKKAFDHFDADGSGDLSIGEIKTVLQSQGMAMSTEEVDQLVQDIDADGNGTIDFPEFLAAMARRAASKAHIGRLQNTVERVITLQKLTLPTFLPLQSSDPRFEIAEAQRQRAVDRMILEQAAQKEDRLKKSSSVAKLQPSKSRAKIDARRPGVSMAADPAPAFSTSNDQTEFMQGEIMTVREALSHDPITTDSTDAPVETFAAFDNHNVSLYAPTIQTLVSDIPQVFCMRVSADVRYVAIVDHNFQAIKSLLRDPEHSTDDYSTFFGVVTIPSSCSKCFICSRGHVDERVKFEVYCQYNILGFIEYSAKQTTLEASRESMVASLTQKDYKKALHYAQVCLFQDVQHVEALECEMICHHSLNRHKLAVETADTILALPKNVLAGDSPIRQKAFEIRAVSSYLRGFPQQAYASCCEGLAQFEASSVLEHYMDLSESARESCLLRRTTMGGSVHADALTPTPAEWRWLQQDNHALNAPFAVTESVGVLAAYLADPFTNEVEKIRAFVRWIGENIEYDGDGLRYGNFAESDCSPEGVLASGKAVCQGYVNLLKAMCDAVQCCECVVLLGFARSGLFSIGDMVVPNHAWNAFRIDDLWYLVDVTWAAGSLQPDFTFRKEFNNYFWMTPPDQFILSHFPENSVFQLLGQLPSLSGSEPVCEGPLMSKADFANSLALSSQVFETGLEMVSHKSSVIEIPAGDSVTVTIRETKPDPLFLFAQIKTLDGSKIMPWDVEVVYDANAKAHTIQVDSSGEIADSYELAIFYCEEESGMYSALVEYRLDIV